MNVYYTHAPVEGPHYASKNAAIAVSGAAYRWRQGMGGCIRWIGPMTRGVGLMRVPTKNQTLKTK